MGGIVISCDSEVINDRQDMGGKEKVGDGRRQIRRGDMQKVSTYMDGIWQSFLLILACWPTSDIVWQCAHVSFE